jgi:hypothetical protein
LATFGKGTPMNRHAACAAFFVAVLLPAAAGATSQGIGAIARWTAMDKCTAAANRAFPDNTQASIVKRDAQLKQCLAGGSLPPRDTESLPSGAKP